MGTTDKGFRTIDEQIELLERRGCRCGEGAADLLLREGYYPLVNGYGKLFTVNAPGEEDRYREGTSLEDIHRVFRFDRALREITFRYLTRVEAAVRNVCAYRFAARHPGRLDYLKKSCYTSRQSYVRGSDRLAGDLSGMINTLEHLADGASKAGVRYYARTYPAVPLWVLAGELTFGSIRRFYDLLERDVQVEVCDDLARLAHPESADERLVTPGWLSRALEELVEARNICAHDDRLFDHEFRGGDLDFRGMLALMDRLITDAEAAERDEAIRCLCDGLVGDLPEVRAYVLPA